MSKRKDDNRRTGSNQISVLIGSAPSVHTADETKAVASTNLGPGFQFHRGSDGDSFDAHQDIEFTSSNRKNRIYSATAILGEDFQQQSTSGVKSNIQTDPNCSTPEFFLLGEDNKIGYSRENDPLQTKTENEKHLHLSERTQTQYPKTFDQLKSNRLDNEIYSLDPQQSLEILLEAPKSRTSTKQAFYFRMAALLVSIIAVALMLGSTSAVPPWHFLAWCSVVSIGVSPWSSTGPFFFGGKDTTFKMCVYYLCSLRSDHVNDVQVPIWWIVISSFVTALFADAFHTSASLGQKHGAAGGFAHAIWYVGIAIMAITICVVRRRMPFIHSLIHALHLCYGHSASGAFTCLVLYRLVNVVWLSTYIASTLFAPYTSEQTRYWGGLLTCVAPCIYCIAGGLRAIIVTETLQGLIAIAMLASILSGIPGVDSWPNSQDSWKDASGLMILRAIQGSCSLPWCSAILTDRLFASSPVISLLAFCLGVAMAFGYSLASSFVGIYASYSGISNVPTAAVQNLGQMYYFMFILLIFVGTMAAVSSSLVAAAKLGGLEVYAMLFQRSNLAGRAQPLLPHSEGVSTGNIMAGRIAALGVAAVGACMVLSPVSVRGRLPDLCVSGVMTLGLGPPCLLLAVWRPSWKRSPAAFLLPLAVSLTVGLAHAATGECRAPAGVGPCVMVVGSVLSEWRIGAGEYANEVGVTVYTLLLSLLACVVGFCADQHFRFVSCSQT